MAKTVVILAAGRGSRLDPGGETHEFSKPLMKLAGMSLLERTVSCCRSAGATKIVVVTGFRRERVENEARRISRGDVVCVHNPEWQRQNGISLLCCKNAVKGSFALLMSDHVFESSILADLLSLTPVPGSVTLAVDRKINQIFDLDDATKVQIFDRRIRSIGKGLSRYDAVDCGAFLCTPAIFDALDAVRVERGDCSLSDGMARIAAVGRFFPFDVGERAWQDVDTPEMLAHALDLVDARRFEQSPPQAAAGAR